MSPARRQTAGSGNASFSHFRLHSSPSGMSNQSHLTSLSLAGCSNLVTVALVGTLPSTNVCNAWFSDLAVAQPNSIPCGNVQFSCNLVHYFYFPLSPGTNAADRSAISHLKSIGWHFVGF